MTTLLEVGLGSFLVTDNREAGGRPPWQVEIYVKPPGEVVTQAEVPREVTCDSLLKDYAIGGTDQRVSFTPVNGNAQTCKHGGQPHLLSRHHGMVLPVLWRKRRKLIRISITLYFLCHL